MVISTEPIAPEEAASAVPRKGTIRPSRLIAFAAIAVVVGGAVVATPSAIAAVQHANADADYQSARTAVTAAYSADAGVHSAYDSARKTAGTLHDAFAKLYEACGSYLPADKCTTLRKEEIRLAGLTALTPGGAAHPYDFYASATASTSTQKLQTAAAKLNTASSGIHAAQKRTLSLAAWLKDATRRATNALDCLTLGSPKSASEAVVTAITADAAAVLAANAKADKASQDALVAAAAAAIAGVKAHKSAVAFMQTYLDKALAVHNADLAQVAVEQAAADAAAAQAAARAGQSTYTDPSTGVAHPTTGRGRSGRTFSGGGTSGGRGTSSGGGSSTGGGTSSGGSTSSGGTVSGYPVYNGPAVPPNSTGTGWNCGSGGITIPSNAVVISQGYDAGAGCYRITYKGPGIPGW